MEGLHFPAPVCSVGAIANANNVLRQYRRNGKVIQCNSIITLKVNSIAKVREYKYRVALSF